MVDIEDKDIDPDGLVGGFPCQVGASLFPSFKRSSRPTMLPGIVPSWTFGRIRCQSHSLAGWILALVGHIKKANDSQIQFCLDSGVSRISQSFHWPWGNSLFLAMSLNEEVHALWECWQYPQREHAGNHGVYMWGLVSQLHWQKMYWVFEKKLLNQPLFSPTDGGQERPGPEIYHRQWIHAGGTCSGLSVQKLIIEFHGLPFLRCGGSGASFWSPSRASTFLRYHWLDWQNPWTLMIYSPHSTLTCQGFHPRSDLEMKQWPLEPWMAKSSKPEVHTWLQGKMDDMSQERLKVIGNVVIPPMAWYAMNALAHQ